MQKQRFSPFVPEKLTAALSGLVQLMRTSLKAYQTATIHLGFEAESSPEKMPAVVISKLPGGNWLLEIPLLPISDWQQVFKFFQFTGWGDGPAVDYGVLAAGPRKLIEEPDQTQLCDAVLGAIEDLILFSGQTSSPILLIGDARGEVIDILGRKLHSLIKKFPVELNLLSPQAFEVDSQVGSSAKEDFHERVQKFEFEAQNKKISFYSTLGYLGVPRFLFLVDSSNEEPQVYFWNGVDFVRCVAPEVIQSVIGANNDSSTVAPIRTPAALVKRAWPKALALLDFETTEEGDSN